MALASPQGFGADGVNGMSAACWCGSSAVHVRGWTLGAFPRTFPVQENVGLPGLRLIFHSLIRKKERLSREGSAGWDF